MKQKLTLKEKLQLIAFAAVANGIFFGVLLGLEWHKVEYKKWFDFLVFTGLVFGTVLYLCWRGLKRMRSFLVFGALLTIHVAICVVYLRSASHIPIVFFAWFSPIEAAIVGLIMTTVGGIRPRLLRHKRYRPGGTPAK